MNWTEKIRQDMLNELGKKGYFWTDMFHSKYDNECPPFAVNNAMKSIIGDEFDYVITTKIKDDKKQANIALVFHRRYEEQIQKILSEELSIKKELQNLNTKLKTLVLKKTKGDFTQNQQS